MVEQGSLHFFFWVDTRAAIRGEKCYPVICGLRATILEESTPVFHGRSPKNSLQSVNFYLSDDCILLIIYFA